MPNSAKISGKVFPEAVGLEDKRGGLQLRRRLAQFWYDFIFPGKLFPCYRERLGEEGESLPPPSCDEWFRFIDHLSLNTEQLLVLRHNKTKQ